MRLPSISRVVVAGVVAAGLAGCGTKTVTVTQTVTKTVTRTVTTAPPPAAAAACQAGDVGGAFASVPGSAGAGQITYELKLTNTSSSSCFVSGLPQLQLLDSAGGQVPTTVSAAQAGQTAAKIVLVPGASASSDARFSPDVPGTGDVTQPGKPCEPVASQLQVTLGGGSLTVPISPPTSVCERGSLRMSDYAAA